MLRASKYGAQKLSRARLPTTVSYGPGNQDDAIGRARLARTAPPFQTQTCPYASACPSNSTAASSHSVYLASIAGRSYDYGIRLLLGANADVHGAAEVQCPRLEALATAEWLWLPDQHPTSRLRAEMSLRLELLRRSLALDLSGRAERHELSSTLSTMIYF